MATMDKQNKQNYLKTKNGKIVIGVVSVVTAILVIFGLYMIMKKSPAKVIKNLENNLIADAKWTTFQTSITDAIDNNKNNDIIKKYKALKKVVSKFDESFLKEMNYLIDEKQNKKPEEETKKQAYESMKTSINQIAQAIKEAQDINDENSQESVNKIKIALDKITKDTCENVVKQSKTAYDIK